jgi:predicted nucleic acid-binding protein
VELTTTIEVVQEFCHVRAHRRPRADAIELARRYATAFSLLITQPEDLHLGLSLWEDHPSLGAFDSVLAAVALNRNAQALVSADKAFAVLPDLHWVDPATPDLNALLAG